jgi:uncharacterized protein YjiS (DUF1127 family)
MAAARSFHTDATIGRHVQTTKIDEQTHMIMSTILSAPPEALCIARQSWVDRLVARLKRWWVAYIAWRIQQGAIAQLKSMNDRELKDIGLSRSQIECAVMSERARDHYNAATLEPFSQEGKVS